MLTGKIPQTFSVRIFYREPTHVMTRGVSPRTYSGTFKVQAASPEEARKCAVAEFREIERRSSVGWIREIDRFEIRHGPSQ